MPQSEQHQFSDAPPTLMNWLANVVLRLPAETRSSLRVDPLPLVGFTDARHSGRGNQDRIAVAYSIEADAAASWLLAVVCDGVGGSSHGERAASMAVASMALDVAGLASRLGAVDSLREVLQRAHAHTSSAFHSKSSTTAVVLLFTGNSAAIGWVGDSRAYEISDGKAALLTTDDTLAGAMARADAGLRFELNEEYAERLSQAIGGENPVRANVTTWRPSSEEAVCLLCTDGVWKPTEAVLDVVVDVCRDGQELLRRLLVMSDWMGGTDNASAILIPSLRVVKEFMRNSANTTPRESMVVCLPGNVQSLISLQGIKGLSSETSRGRQDRQAERADFPIPKQRKASPKKKTTSPKGRLKVDIASKQLVIAEEPLDETPPSPPDTIQGDGPST